MFRVPQNKGPIGTTLHIQASAWGSEKWMDRELWKSIRAYRGIRDKWGL